MGIFLLLLTNSSLGQDTLYIGADQHIACKVLEITPTEVKYKRWGLLDGPLYIESKQLVVRIKYANGFVDTFPEEGASIAKESEKVYPRAAQKKYPDLTTIAGERTIYFYDGRPIGESNMHDLLVSLNNPKITEEVRRAEHAKRLGYWGFLTIPFGVAGVICAANSVGFLPTSYNAGKEFAGVSALFFAGAALSIGTTIHFDIKNREANKKAIRLYRQNYLDE